ncbi:hypothetical protein CPB86DRAFT_803460 [Serendipita vermifera]|nr:hypothetical protein CPB86DRAFT_803460 [Serendipita vermifera]
MHRENAVLENVFGTIGLGDRFIWAVSAAFLGVYAIVQNINIPIIVQPQTFGALAAISWIQCLYYDGKRSKTFCFGLFAVFTILFAGFEVSMTFAARAAVKHGEYAFLRFFGVFSGVLICLALIPQFIEIYRIKQVQGISLTFMAVDISGGVFSILSLVFKKEMDWIAAVTYLGVVVLDSAIVVLAFILNRKVKDAQEPPGSQESQTMSSSRTSEATSGFLEEKSHNV